MGGIGSGRKPKVKTEALAVVAAAPVAAVGALGAVVDVQTAKLTQYVREALEADTDVPMAKRGKATPKWRRAMLVALSANGMPHKEIAEVVGMTPRSVRTTLYNLRKAGVLVDVADQLDHLIVPDAIEALHQDVLHPERPGHQKAYLAALQGRGALRSEHAPSGTAVPQVANLQVNFVMPEGTARPVLTGTVVGTGRTD